MRAYYLSYYVWHRGKYYELIFFLSLRNIPFSYENHKPYIVHRLDKETSGVLIVAKTREYAQLFTSLFRIRKIHKTYIALTHGRISKDIKTLRDDLVTFENGKRPCTCFNHLAFNKQPTHN